MRQSIRFLKSLIYLMCFGLLGFSPIRVLSAVSGYPVHGEWEEPVSIYQSASAAAHPVQVINWDGRVLAFFGYGSEQLGYHVYKEYLIAERDPNGNWMPVYKVPTFDMSLEEGVQVGPVYNLSALVDKHGGLHLIWSTIPWITQSYHPYFAYMYRPPGGLWTDPQKMDFIGYPIVARLGPDNSLYVAGSNVLLTRSPSGEWTSESAPSLSDFTLDVNGTMHALSRDQPRGYIYKQEGQGWSTPVPLNPGGNDPYEPRILLDFDSQPQIIWMKQFTYDCFPTTCYSYRIVHREVINGTLSDTTFVSPEINLIRDEIPIQFSAFMEGGKLHVFWSNRFGSDEQTFLTYHIERKTNSQWSSIEQFEGRMIQAIGGDQEDLYLITRGNRDPLAFWYVPTLGWSELKQKSPYFNASIASTSLGPQSKQGHTLMIIFPAQFGTNDYRLLFRQFVPLDYHNLFLPAIF